MAGLFGAARRYRRFASSLLADLPGYARFAWKLRGFLREPLSLDEARAIVRRRMETRETSFLRVAEAAIFSNPRSPYRALFKLAGCELGDLANMLQARGLDGALDALREAGVHLTYEEFKGRKPIVRHGRTISAHPEDFDNPLVRGDYHGTSGGTSGSGTPVPVSLDNVAEHAPDLVLAYSAHDILMTPTVLWRGILPDTSAMSHLLRGAKLRLQPAKWYTPAATGNLAPIARHRTATHFIVLATRALGAKMPWPEPLDVDQALVLANWAIATVRRHGACVLHAPVSLALRVAVAATRENLRMEGITLLVSGEPLTEAKEEILRRTGAGIVPLYAFAEAGVIGVGCPEAQHGDAIHVFMDAFAVTRHARRLQETSLVVDALYFTSLLPAARKILLNIEADDSAVMDTRRCGCLMGACGFTQHLSRIRSFSKLTSEGEAFLAADMIRIVEQVLPARFGGGPLDYQLIEDEADDGFTRLTLLVSPEIPIPNEASVVEAVLNAVDRSTRGTWQQANILTVRRAKPIWTDRGKLLPIVPLQFARRHRDIAAIR